MSKFRVIALGCILLIAVALVARLYMIWPTLTPQITAQTRQITGQPASPPTPTPTPRPRLRPDLATGMILPQWGPKAYSASDKNWTQGLQEVQSQTAARWIGLYIQFHQDSEFTPNVHRGADAPTPEGVKAGVELAHKLGYHVYVFPAITLDGPHSWAGYIRYADNAENQNWFDNYWQQLQPYVQACAEANCDRFSIGNEYEGLERSPATYWHQLLQRVHSIYSGQIVYNMNFSSQQKYPVPDWMSDPLLSEVGVSAYYSLTDTEQSLPQAQLPALWKSHVQAPLDTLSKDLGKPVFIAEIGYRDSNFAGYNPYQAEDNGTRDDQMQAALYNAAMQNIADDKKIDGVFIWAWSMQPFTPKNKPAAKTLFEWYDKL